MTVKKTLPMIAGVPNIPTAKISDIHTSMYHDSSFPLPCMRVMMVSVWNSDVTNVGMMMPPRLTTNG